MEAVTDEVTVLVFDGVLIAVELAVPVPVLDGLTEGVPVLVFVCGPEPVTERVCVPVQEGVLEGVVEGVPEPVCEPV